MQKIIIPDLPQINFNKDKIDEYLLFGVHPPETI